VLSLSGNSGVNTIWAKTYGHTFELTSIDLLIGGHICIYIYTCYICSANVHSGQPKKDVSLPSPDLPSQ